MMGVVAEVHFEGYRLQHVEHQVATDQDEAVKRWWRVIDPQGNVLPHRADSEADAEMVADLHRTSQL